MFLCSKCNRYVCNPCQTPYKHSGDPREVFMASTAQLRSRAYVRRLAIATRNLGLSRREIPNWMADVIFEFEGVIRSHDRQVLTITDTAIDDAFGNDGSFRWLSDFMAFAEKPLRQNPQMRVIVRLQLLDITFKIDKPEIAKHFGR